MIRRASYRLAFCARPVFEAEVWDIETIPDLKGFAAANGHDGKSDDAPQGLLEWLL